MKISLSWLKTHVDLDGVTTDQMRDMLTFAGTIGLFLTLFLIFARFLPMIAISEVKGVLAVQKHTFKDEEVVAHDLR